MVNLNSQIGSRTYITCLGKHWCMCSNFQYSHTEWYLIFFIKQDDLPSLCTFTHSRTRLHHIPLHVHAQPNAATSDPSACSRRAEHGYIRSLCMFTHSRTLLHQIPLHVHAQPNTATSHPSPCSRTTEHGYITSLCMFTHSRTRLHHIPPYSTYFVLLYDVKELNIKVNYGNPFIFYFIFVTSVNCFNLSIMCVCIYIPYKHVMPCNIHDKHVNIYYIYFNQQ